MTEPVKTRNVYEIRQDRLITGWTVDFQITRKLIRRRWWFLLVILVGMEVAHWLIF